MLLKILTFFQESALLSKESFVEAIESKYKGQINKSEKTIGSLEHQLKMLKEQVRMSIFL